MRRIPALAALAACALALPTAAQADKTPPVNVTPVGPIAGPPVGKGSALTMAVYGDSPYGVNPTDTQQFDASPAFIDTINADPNVSTVVHVGDIHSGKQYCTEAYDRSIFNLWRRFADPLVYTPGDNEWSDCHKPGEGGNILDSVGNPVDFANGNPVANLALLRSIFFSDPGALLGGPGKRRVTSQATAYDRAFPADAAYAENVRWQDAGVVFMTLNIPGGSNNDTDPWYGAPITQQQTDEVANRTAADLRWLDAAFAQARGAGARAVVIIEQADMWDVDGKTPAHLIQYEPLISRIAANTTAFGRPVLLFNGDSHVYNSDNPLSATESSVWSSHPYYAVSNFHRITVNGSTFPLEWLRLSIDPSADVRGATNAFGPFSWQRRIQAQLTP